MDIDEYLKHLNDDLNNNLSDLKNQLDKSLTGFNESKEAEQEYFCFECGAKVGPNDHFCPNCGCKLDDVDEEEDAPAKKDFDDDEEPEEDTYSDEDEEPEDDENAKHGILLTDTNILADKYGIDRQEVLDGIWDFIEKEANQHISWHFIDAAIAKDLDHSSWKSYRQMVLDECEHYHIATGPELALFIIGGDDVIPQPKELNPSYQGNDESQKYVYADFYYSFDGVLNLEFMDFSKAICNVGRLPLETGKMKTTFKDDIVAYLHHSNTIVEDGGICITMAVMTSNIDWIPASIEMSRNIPCPHVEDVEGEIKNNMYLSPAVLANDMPEDLRRRYEDDITSTPMLMFNLHGSNQSEQSGFYSTDLAFSIGMLKEINPQIFNTVACWGARYIHYSREESMLLTAMYHSDVLLYAGACVPALGKCGNFHHDENWRIQPAAYSETFMGRFSQYECLGKMPAGEAFLKAKCDYYNTSRMVEDDECILATVLMFNLYGNPLLTTYTDEESLQDLQESAISNECENTKSFVPFRKMKKETVYVKNSNNKSLLGDITNAVNSNLSYIHQAIADHLYKELGLEPRSLSAIESYSYPTADGTEEKGFLYNYDKPVKGFTSRIIAKVDNNGNLVDAIQTK